MASQRVRASAVLLLCFGLCTTLGCAREDEASQTEQTKAATDSAAPPTPQERALEAQKALFERLSTALLSAMANGGPTAAIETCSKQAPKIAAEVGRKHGVRIGRTSFRLRNPSNQPPEWAAEFIEQRVEEPQFVELENQATGALLPIRVQGQCLTCHGPADTIADDVKQQLAQQYPEDQATGFNAGDLRGWFWVEVPPADEATAPL